MELKTLENRFDVSSEVKYPPETKKKFVIINIFFFLLISHFEFELSKQNLDKNEYLLVVICLSYVLFLINRPETWFVLGRKMSVLLIKNVKIQLKNPLLSPSFFSNAFKNAFNFYLSRPKNTFNFVRHSLKKNGSRLDSNRQSSSRQT